MVRGERLTSRENRRESCGRRLKLRRTTEWLRPGQFVHPKGEGVPKGLLGGLQKRGRGLVSRESHLAF